MSKWEEFKQGVKEDTAKMKEDLRKESEQIEFKRAKRRPSPLMRSILWTSIVVNLIFAAILATTVIGIPISMIILIGCIYLYQVYLRRGV